MELVSNPAPLFNPATLFSDEKVELIESPIIAVLDPKELSFELGLWLAGLESFLRSGGSAFTDSAAEDLTRDWMREVRLARAALLNCSKLNFHLRKSLIQEPDSEMDEGRITVSELDSFALVLRETIVLSESVLGARKLNFGDWKAWSTTLSEKLLASPVRHKLVNCAAADGLSFLPEKLRSLLTSKKVAFAHEVDLQVILSQFGTILGSLGVVGRMLENDEPLKPSLLIFSHVHEQVRDLIAHMNNRLARFPDEKAAMFDSLDGASYTASLELKKVFSQELTGLAGIRPVPTVFARVETAFELLSDSFRQILAGFARVMDPSVSPSDLFPKFQTKLEESLALRQHIWALLQRVQAAEQKPEKPILEAASAELHTFLSETVGYLFHKDRETIERFAEEVFALTEKKDLVPILHRFGAYLETLLGQINMRTVLAQHPFDPKSN